MNYQYGDFLLLAFLSVTYSTALIRVEQLRLAVAAREVPNIDNLWAFAAVLLLPAPLLVALALVIYAGEWRARGIVGQPVGRYLYSAGSLAASACIASYTLHHIHGPVGVIAAGAVYAASNVALIAAAMTVAGHFRAMRMFCSVRAHRTELSTITAGAFMAGAMTWHATVAVAALPALSVLHRSELQATVRARRAFDPATGLWNEVGWRVQGRQMLLDTTGHVVLMVIDPDGPGMEADIAANLGNGIRPGDLIGRYGTRQVILMASVGPASVGRVLASRIRGHLAEAGIPATLGCATVDSGDLRDLVIAAMCDLMGRREMAGVDQRW